MNITEKILARGSGKSKLEPGEIIFAKVDKIMLHDVSGPGVIKVFDKLKKEGEISVEKLHDPSKVWVAEDHFVPSAEKVSAENIVKLSNFTKQYGIERHFKYGMGQYGICHTLSHEEALVLPGEVYVGGDSHTNTTGAMGAFACGLGHTDIAYVLLNGQIWFKVPETLYFKINGALPENVKVNRDSTDMSAIPLPPNSIAIPAPPSVPISPIIFKIKSFAMTFSGRIPLI